MKLQRDLQHGLGDRIQAIAHHLNRDGASLMTRGLLVPEGYLAGGGKLPNPAEIEKNTKAT